MSFMKDFIHTKDLTEDEKLDILAISERTGLSLVKTMLLYVAGELTNNVKA